MKNIDQNKVFSEEISILSLQYLCGVPLKSIKWSNQVSLKKFLTTIYLLNTFFLVEFIFLIKRYGFII